MALENIANKVAETDVLVIGGGLAGCLVAAKAKEHGLDVILVEKAKPERSGSAAQGLDHYGGLPGDGLTTLELLRTRQNFVKALNGDGRFMNPNLAYRSFDNALWGLEELERLGLPMRWDDGEFYWIPSYSSGGLRTMIRVHWQNIKPLLGALVRKKGVNVFERTMVVDLLTNSGAVVGATAVNTRTGEFIVIKAKAVVTATGIFCRIYDPETPLFYKYKFRYHFCPASISGDGLAAAYRAGAELVNMDITGWHFRIREDLTLPFGLFGMNDGLPAHYLTWDGEELPAITPARMYAELERNGKTPLYRTLEFHPDDWHKRIEVACVDERFVSLKIGEDRGFNPKTHRYEHMINKPHNFQFPSGIYVGEEFMTLLKGLYSVGACTAGVECVPVSGLLVGDNIHTYVSQAGEPKVDEGQVESQKKTALAPLSVKDGTEPMELESSIRYICERYVGQFKSEGKLLEGQRRLGSMRRVFLPKLMAKNPHYLMRCLEVRNLLDLADLHIQAAMERKETRGNHIRLDYPEKDPSRDNMITHQRMEDGKAVLEIREMPDLKPEYAKEGK